MGARLSLPKKSNRVGENSTGPRDVLKLSQTAQTMSLPSGRASISHGKRRAAPEIRCRNHSDFIHKAPSVAPSLAPTRTRLAELHSPASFFLSRNAFAAAMSL